MHRIADEVQSVISVPLIHIAEETAREIRKHNIERVLLLLGTRYTMELDFFSDTLAQVGIESIIPEKADREFIHASIYNELVRESYYPKLN